MVRLKAPLLMKKLPLIIFLISIAFVLRAQKKGTVTFISDSTQIAIDGNLNEGAWAAASILTNFTEIEPNPGIIPNQKTEIKILYDNRGLYFGINNLDSAPDSILKELSQRDNFGNVDWSGVVIDPYKSGLNAFGFYVSAAGVQGDAKYTPGEDFSWNAVWRSQVQTHDSGWVAEFFVPFSALRFPENDVKSWNFNAIRTIRRSRQKFSWNYVDPKINGFLNQFGSIEGLIGIKTPVRLQLFPYLSAYYDEFDGEQSTFVNGGLDVKYGLSDAFTLDLTLIPDFGQVQSDNQVLNLSPFEVQFNENRQFFTEGTELFNKGGLFYSRRIGSTPLNSFKVNAALEEGDEIIENPSTTQLLNATKVSGRLDNGLGIGVFNAITSETQARIKKSDGSEEVITTDPASNYSVLVLDQNLKNNSSITLLNTNVLRAGDTYDANVTGLFGNIRNKKATLVTDFQFIYNKKFGFDDSSTDDGFAYQVGLQKISGNLNYGSYINVESDTYDPNDLGFLFNANEFTNGGYISYSQFKPKGRWNRSRISLNLTYSQLYKPRAFTNFNIDVNGNATSRDFNTYGYNFGAAPVENVDFFEPRKAGFFYNIPASYYFGGFISSDYRKTVAIDGNFGFRKFDQNNRYAYDFSIGPRVRFNNHLLLTYRYSYSNRLNDEGFAISNSIGRNLGVDRPNYNPDLVYFGRRDVQTHTNLLNLEYKINPLMYSTLRIRHYWSKVLYNSYHVLQEDGYLSNEAAYNGQNTDGQSLHNNDFNAFNVDLVYTFVFSPGSRLDIVYKKSILNSKDSPSRDFSENARTLTDVPGVNSLSLKFLYFIDYNDARIYLKDRF